MAARAAALMEMADLVEEFLLRLPPDDPASLVRAALVCKLWRRVLTDRGFRRRFCELHRRPPMLGFLDFRLHDHEPISCFTPTSSFRPRNADLLGRYLIDSRHGRVLLARSLYFPNFSRSNRSLAVWDPISGDWLGLPKLPAQQHLDDLDSVGIRWNAAVLCASNPSTSACDCHHGHFLVVLNVYSSEAATWSKPTSAALAPIKHLSTEGLGALVGNALYFKGSYDLSAGILKYDLGTQEISSVNQPPYLHGRCHTLLTTTQYGVLGIASVDNLRLHLWFGEAGPGGHLEWAPSRAIELSMVLPANTDLISVVAFVHGPGAFLVSTIDGVFSVDLDSNRARKVGEDGWCIKLVPYISFCTPAAAPDVALTYTGEGPGASVPNV